MNSAIVKHLIHEAIGDATRAYFGDFLIDDVAEELGAGQVQQLLGGAGSRARFCWALASACNERLEQLYDDGHVATWRPTTVTFLGGYGMRRPGPPAVHLHYSVEA